MFAPDALEVRYPQLAKEPLLTSELKAHAENRVLAKLVDIGIVELVIWTMSFFSLTLAWFFPILFWSYIDRSGRGQSPGKWLLGLHTIEVQRGYRPSIYQGLVRNFPFILFSLGLGSTGVWIWVFLIPSVFGILLEAYFIFNVRSGIRVGDVIGYTRVADYKDEHTKFIEQFLKEDDIL